MTVAAANRRALRVEIFPHVLSYLQTRSMMRYGSRPKQLRAAAKKITQNVVAMNRRLGLVDAGA